MTSTGDSAQIRLIAEQVVKAAIIEVRDQMPKSDSEPRVTLATIIGVVIGILGFILALGGIVYSAGTQAGKIEENRRRIDALELRNDRMLDAIARIDTRTAVMESKLRQIIPDAPEGRHGDTER